MTTVDRIAAIVSEIAPGHPVDRDTPLTELHLDSLGCIELTVAVEDAFHVDIACHERIEFRTMGCIAQLVDTKVREALPLAA